MCLPFSLSVHTDGIGFEPICNLRYNCCRYLMVARAGLEPARPYGQRFLRPLCLPIPPPGHLNKSTCLYLGLMWTTLSSFIVSLNFTGVHWRTRTLNLEIRNLLLYPVELSGHVVELTILTRVQGTRIPKGL